MNFGAAETLPDESATASDLPAGSVEAFVLDAQGRPLVGVEAKLGILFQKISEGESRTEKVARSGADGRVRFDQLKPGSDYSYRLSVVSGAATYGSTSFNLTETAGHRLRLHILPVTRDINAALIGMRGFVYIEPRDDVFQFEVLYRVFNVGTTTWVPEDAILKLPADFKAFKAQEAAMGDTGFEQVEGRGARLKGTFTPGQHDVSFRFQVPKPTASSVDFSIGALQHVAEFRVLVEASPQMSLTVEGFEKPVVDRSRDGKRIVVTRRVLQRGDENFEGAAITLAGLPVPGNGRWIAVLIAAGFALLGLATTRGWLRLDASNEHKQGRDIAVARELLLTELVEVERLRQAGSLGPRAYGEARRTLLDALTRLGSEALSAGPSRRPKAA